MLCEIQLHLLYINIIYSSVIPESDFQVGGVQVGLAQDRWNIY